MASGKGYAVPYKSLEEETTRFIEEQYMPPGFVMKDPKKLHKNAEIKLLTHILQRQQSVGVEQAFRFHIYQNKKGEHDARYPDSLPAAHKKGRKKKKKSPGNKAIDPTAAADPTATADPTAAADPTATADSTAEADPTAMSETTETIIGDGSVPSRESTATLEAEARVVAAIEAAKNEKIIKAAKETKKKGKGKQITTGGKSGMADTGTALIESTVRKTRSKTTLKSKSGTGDTLTIGEGNKGTAGIELTATKSRGLGKRKTTLKSRVGKADALTIEEAKTILGTKRRSSNRRK